VISNKAYEMRRCISGCLWNSTLFTYSERPILGTYDFRPPRSPSHTLSDIVGPYKCVCVCVCAEGRHHDMYIRCCVIVIGVGGGYIKNKFIQVLISSKPYYNIVALRDASIVKPCQGYTDDRCGCARYPHTHTHTLVNIYIYIYIYNV